MNIKIRLILFLAIFSLIENKIKAQVFVNRTDEKHVLTTKAGWDQTIAAGFNYSYAIKPFFKTHQTNLQIEFVSPLGTFFNFSNHRFSLGVQSMLFNKNKFHITANLFGTFSRSQDVTAKMNALGIYASLISALQINKNWLIGFELAYRPTIFTHINFTHVSDDTFMERYPDTRGLNEIPQRDGWYSFTNQKYQIGLLVNKRWNSRFQTGLKMALEHFNNENNVLLNGWIGQIPLNANLNFSYNF